MIIGSPFGGIWGSTKRAARGAPAWASTFYGEYVDDNPASSIVTFSGITFLDGRAVADVYSGLAGGETLTGVTINGVAAVEHVDGSDASNSVFKQFSAVVAAGTGSIVITHTAKPFRTSASLFDVGDLAFIIGASGNAANPVDLSVATTAGDVAIAGAYIIDATYTLDDMTFAGTTKSHDTFIEGDRYFAAALNDSVSGGAPETFDADAGAINLTSGLIGIYGAALLANLLPVAGDRTKRQGMVEDHFPPSPAAGFEGDYTGISDETGFTTITCSSAGDLATEMNNATLSQKLVLECAWNGNSTSSQRMFGYTNTTLTVDGAIDWGYVRPTGAIVIRPASGYSPVYESTYSSGIIDMVGFSKLHIEDMVFENPAMKLGYTATYPCWVMAAIKNCTFQNGTNSDNGAIALSGLRVLHATGNDFVDCDAGFIGGPNFFRSWDNTFKGMADNDVHGIRGAPHSTHTTHVWVAGAVVYDMSARKPGSGLHCDFLQTSHPADAHVGYSVLAEMNMAHLDRGGTMYATQMFFGDDGSGFSGDWLVHNNVGMISAYWATMAFDPTDNQDKVITKNIFMRAATPSATQDAFTRVRGLKVSTGTGTLTVRDNIATSFDTGFATGESFSSNVVADPRTSASSPNKYVDRFTGNGTWGTDVNGRLDYTSPDAGAASSTAAKTAITNFTKPIAGWSGSAPENPASWPTGDYANLT